MAAKIEHALSCIYIYLLHWYFNKISVYALINMPYTPYMD